MMVDRVRRRIFVRVNIQLPSLLARHSSLTFAPGTIFHKPFRNRKRLSCVPALRTPPDRCVHTRTPSERVNFHWDYKLLTLRQLLRGTLTATGTFGQESNQPDATVRNLPA